MCASSVSLKYVVAAVQSLSHIRLPNPMGCSMLGCSVLHSLSLLKFISIESVMPSNHLILCRPLLLLPSIFPSIRVFSSELAFHIRWQSTQASASSSVLPMNTQGWSPLGWTGLVLQSLGLSSVFSSTAILWYSAFFMIQLSHLYLTTGSVAVKLHGVMPVNHFPW